MWRIRYPRGYQILRITQIVHDKRRSGLQFDDMRATI